MTDAAAMKKYSIVSYIEGEAKREVRALQEKLTEITGSRQCLDAWEPHITVGDGVWVADDERSEIERVLEHIANETPVFETTLEGFGGLINRKAGEGEESTPFVLWVDVEVNDCLRQLVSKIENQVAFEHTLWYQMPRPYTPHVTLAFRDLTKEGHALGEEYLKSLQFEMQVPLTHVVLVEKLPEKDEEYKRFYFREMH